MERVRGDDEDGVELVGVRRNEWRPVRPGRIAVRPLEREGVACASDALAVELGGRLQARRSELIDVLADQGFVDWLSARRVGLLTHRPDGPARIELSALLAVDRGRGVG